MIQVEDVHKTLGGQKVLDGVTFSIDKGMMVCLLGRSGAGKSVLLRNMIGLMRPDSGRVLVDGQDIHESTGEDLTKVRNSLGVLFQGGALFDSMTVYENLAFPLQEKTRLSPDEIARTVREHLDMVEMLDTDNKYPAELSGGMRKRVALARALILDPSNVFFDEPTTGLDPLIANAILRLIFRLHRQLKFSGVIVTHDAEKVFQVVQHVAMLYKGKIIAYDAPDIFLKSAEPVVQEYIRETTSGPLEALSVE